MAIFDEAARTAILRNEAATYVSLAIENVVREYPHFPMIIADTPGAYPSHRASHPAFFGSFDWHSCVEMHWVIVRLLRRFPDDVPQETARGVLDSLLTSEHLAQEATFFGDPKHRSLERPYGWGWLMTLAHELAVWDDADGRRWLTALEPLVDVLTNNFLEWLPKLTYPVRCGFHPNTAFGLLRTLDHAELAATRGQPALRDTIRTVAVKWFRDDTDYPARYEPSGNDFISAALAEAELMARLLPSEEFSGWFDRFLPGLAEGHPNSLMHPATVSDMSDGHIAHLAGLNLSRAASFVALAESLPADDARGSVMLTAAERHAHASLGNVTGSDYMAEHWLAAYAVLLLS